MVAARMAVSAPTTATTIDVLGVNWYRADERATMYTPATTMVAAWIRAETGVGPSMASGNQMCSGNMADLPAPPMKTRIMDQVMVDKPRNTIPPPCIMAGPCGFVREIKSKVPVVYDRIRIPMRKPRSANRVTIKAFLEAATAESFV